MDRHGTVREGIIAGALGATGVAVWFLIVDTITGQPFFTPRVLGEAIEGVVAPDAALSPFSVVALYTVFHYAVFFLAGITIIGLVHASARHVALLSGVVMLFIAFEVAFYAYVAVLRLATPLDIAWFQIGAANLIAAALMGRYLWSMHPELTHRLDESLSGRH